MKEMNKMRASLLYDFSKEEIVESFKHAKELCVQLQNLTVYSNDYRKVISQLIPVFLILQQLHLHLIVTMVMVQCQAKTCFINCNCVFLDGGEIRIGKNTLIGPACQFYTNQHPTDYLERRKPQEVCLPITIGEDTWIGGSVVILPGVTIGDRCIIAAGSLVMHDIPSDCVVAGSPAVIKRKLNKE